MPRPTAGRTHLTVEPLEPRETPTTGLWSVESFNESGAVLPTAWAQWPAGSARVAAGAGVDSTAALVEPAYSSVSRAWETSVLPADYGVQASLRWDGAGSAQLFVRGSQLDTTRPTYLAAGVSAGGTVQVVRVVSGSATVLASLKAAAWPPGQWVRLMLLPQGDRLSVVVQRLDGDLYLNPAGQWQPGATAALTAIDRVVRSGGRAGIARPVSGTGRIRIDDFGVIAPELPAPSAFAAQPADSVPVGWSAWGSDGDAGFRTTGSALASSGGSTRASRAWLSAELPEDVTATATVLVDSLIPAQVIARGRDLNTSRPTYYAASVVRGTEINLLRVVDGASTQLGMIRTTTYLSGAWLNVSLTVQSDRLQVRVRRTDTAEWLNPFGDWQPQPAVALAARDGRITGAGFVGLGRAVSAVGTVVFGDVQVTPADGYVIAPRASVSVRPLEQSTTAGSVSGVVRLQSTAADSGRVDRVEFFVDGSLVRRVADPPYGYDLETRNLSNAAHTVAVRVWDAAGNLGESSVVIRVQNRFAASRPAVPRHYTHIRVAALAYTGNPMGPDELARLRNSIDLVIPNTRYLGTINAAAPATPQLIYSNISNLYLDSLTDWLNYADTHGLPREAAFYHVAQPTAFVGDSPSSQPVTWFWNVAHGPSVGTAGFVSRTQEARGGKPGGVPFGGAREATFIGYPDRFAELNLTVTRNGSSQWAGLLEYPTRVDAAGRPTAWATLVPTADTTNGLLTTGRVTFDPPADWRPAVVPGSAARLYYVRLRSTAGGLADAPIAGLILGRDYVNAGGGQSGVIPAFDTVADANRDGYLNAAEYADRRPGFDARFAYESRLFYPHYGQMRFVTNPSGAGVAAWAADFQRRLLAANPLADGVFMDNSGGHDPTEGAPLVESTDTYAADYGAVLGAVNRGIAPKWVLANTAGGGADAARVVRQVPGTIEEFALRPLAQSWAQFQDLAATVSRRLTLNSPTGYLVLDSLSTGGSPTDPRTRMAALADFYLLADPAATFFMAWGGEEPASAWSRHWWDAIAFNVGKPKGPFSEFASGTDPASPALSYHVFERAYDNALVLYKPLSYATGVGSGGTGDATATVHSLDGNYRLLNADGSLGPVTRTVTLRNGEGAILVRA
jgi:hypothetical protein